MVLWKKDLVLYRKLWNFDLLRINYVTIEKLRHTIVNYNSISLLGERLPRTQNVTNLNLGCNKHIVITGSYYHQPNAGQQLWILRVPARRWPHNVAVVFARYWNNPDWYIAINAEHKSKFAAGNIPIWLKNSWNRR